MKIRKQRKRVGKNLVITNAHGVTELDFEKELIRHCVSIDGKKYQAEPFIGADQEKISQDAKSVKLIISKINGQNRIFEWKLN